MPDPPTETSGGQRAERITQLKPPVGLDFAHEEIQLFMDLAMEGRDEKVKVKMFLYIIRSKGREIYETLHFEKARDERTLQDVMNAFEEHCNPKKNETVERYKFFTRIQEEGESMEKFVTEFKVIGCNMQFWNASRFTNSRPNYLWNS